MKVTYGTRPGMISITAPMREPIVVYDRNDALKLINDLCDALQKAWPKSDLLGVAR